MPIVEVITYRATCDADVCTRQPVETGYCSDQAEFADGLQGDGWYVNLAATVVLCPDHAPGCGCQGCSLHQGKLCTSWLSDDVHGTMCPACVGGRYS